MPSILSRKGSRSRSGNGHAPAGRLTPDMTNKDFCRTRGRATTCRLSRHQATLTVLLMGNKNGERGGRISSRPAGAGYRVYDRARGACRNGGGGGAADRSNKSRDGVRNLRNNNRACRRGRSNGNQGCIQRANTKSLPQRQALVGLSKGGKKIHRVKRGTGKGIQARGTNSEKKKSPRGRGGDYVFVVRRCKAVGINIQH